MSSSGFALRRDEYDRIRRRRRDRGPMSPLGFLSPRDSSNGGRNAAGGRQGSLVAGERLGYPTSSSRRGASPPADARRLRNRDRDNHNRMIRDQWESAHSPRSLSNHQRFNSAQESSRSRQPERNRSGGDMNDRDRSHFHRNRPDDRSHFNEWEEGSRREHFHSERYVGRDHPGTSQQLTRRRTRDRTGDGNRDRDFDREREQGRGWEDGRFNNSNRGRSTERVGGGRNERLDRRRNDRPRRSDAFPHPQDSEHVWRSDGSSSNRTELDEGGRR